KLCGVFSTFWFWTVIYASQYASAVPLSTGWEYFKIGAGQAAADAPLIWLLAAGGFLFLCLRSKHRGIQGMTPGSHHDPLQPARRHLIPGTLAGAAAVCAGFMFRGQYFILLAGFAWEKLLGFLAPLSGKLRLAAATTIAATAFGALLEPFLLGMLRTPNQICRVAYGMNPFPEAPVVAQYLREHTKPHDRVAVLGSEPEIYFLADRRPASPYLYVYEMMKPHSRARQMQEETIRSIATARPTFLVVVDVPTSWGIGRDSGLALLSWLDAFTRNHYTLEGVLDLVTEDRTIVRWGEAARAHQTQSPYTIRIYKRTNGQAFPKPET
ncbi:MAG: hypothetical protein PHV34_16515, partial [Verrucomicrobiae bacterium]|nr:hypothetical protein [Verrucomicrobiae bacterium]